MLVIELGSAVDVDEFRRAGLTVLDGSESKVVVAFADDPQLAAFKERLDKFDAGKPEGQKTEPYADFIDSVVTLRPMTARDRISAEVASKIADMEPHEELRLDLILWHPDDLDTAYEWLGDVTTAVNELKGTVVDQYVNDDAGVLLARVYLAAGGVSKIAEAVDALARIELLPTPKLTATQLYAATEDALPEIHHPADTAPLVGLVDSGIASAHPLITPAAAAAEALSGAIPDGEDRHGHGTMVAGLLLYGRLDVAISRGTPLRPICRIVSVSVLDSQNLFPEEELWERDLAEAVEWCARQGARIINLSVGDSRRPLRGPRQNPAAAIIDQLAREHDLAIFVAAGNSRPADYLAEVNEEALLSYPEILVRDSEARVIDPGSSALALTVGGVTEAAAATGMATKEVVSRRPFGRPGWPSPLTRTGPGVGGSVKPELVELAGTVGLEEGQIVSNDAELNVISTVLREGRLLGHNNGVSFATPLASRVAAAVAARFPEFSGELLRALTLLSTQPTNTDFIQADKPSVKAQAALQLAGFGRPSIARAIESQPYRAILISENTIDINGVHVYEIPIPNSFLQTGGERGIDVALAFSPRTRLGRLDYMASTMQTYLTRGLSLDEIIEVFTKLEDEELETESDEEEVNEEEVNEVNENQDAENDEETIGPDDQTPTPSKLGRRNIRLVPSTQIRSRGANQLGRRTFKQKWQDEDLPCYLIVRNVNKWDDPTSTQSYAASVALWHSQEDSQVFAELETQLEAVVEVPVEIEI